MNDSKNISIKKSFLLIASFVIVAAIMLAAWLIVTAHKNQNRRNIFLLQSYAGRVESVFVDDVNYTTYQMQYISDQIKSGGIDPKYINKLLSSFKVNSKVNVAISWNMFSWMDKNKFVTIDGTIGILDKPVDLSTRDYVDYTFSDPGKLYLGKKPVYGVVSKQWVLPAGMGVVDKNNKYVGAIVFGFDVKSIVYKLESVINDSKVNFAIVGGDGTIIAESSNSFKENDQRFIKDLLKDNQKSEIIIKPKSIFDKETSYFYYKKIPISDFGVIICYDKIAAHQQLHDLWFRHVIEFGLIILIALILLVVINHKIIKPIINIAKIAEEITLHKNDIDFPKSGAKEIIDISRQLSLIDKYKKDLLGASKRIEQLNLAKSSFLSSVSHELRSPVVSIEAIATLLMDKEYIADLNEEQKNDLIGDIKMLSIESLEFINDLLDINQAESGNFKLGELKDEDIASLINRSIKMMQGRATRSSIYIKSEIEKDLPKFKCDQKRIKQILINLISNAIKYSKGGTTIKVIAHKIANNKIQITITDQGFGMSEDEVKVALQKYGTVKNENSDKVDSLGLGLSIVQYLINISGGKFNIISKKDEGTTVEIVFG